MARSDLSLEELRTYRPQVAEPDDFDAFWDATLSEARGHDLDLRLSPVEHPFTSVDIRDVLFSGYGGDPVSGWLITPTASDGPLPVVVEYIGYGGGRDLPGQHLQWANAGFAHLLMDTRGQGSSWGTGGATPDPHGSVPHTPGVMTMGIDDPATYYYRRLFTDAVRATEAARQLPGVDAATISVNGISQGGGVSLAVAGLVPDLTAVMPDVPFLCHFRRAVDICDRDPYTEITRYLSVHRNNAETVFSTLSYFDGVNFAKRAESRALFSVALMDTICPPSTVMAAYHSYAAEKSVEVYEFNDHEGGAYRQRLRQIRWLKDLLAR